MVGHRVEEFAVQRGIECHAQFPVVVVIQGNKAERLQTCALKFARRRQHLGHAVDVAGAGVESDFDEISGGKFLLQLQQTAIGGNGLQFGARPAAAFGHYGGGHRSIQLYARRTMGGMSLGEVSHSRLHYAMPAPAVAGYESACTRAYARWAGRSLPAAQVCDNNGSNFPACARKSTFGAIDIDDIDIDKTDVRGMRGG